MQDRHPEKEFETEINDHKALIYKVCRMYANTEPDRQDLFQEIVIHLWKAYPKFKAQSKFSTWLYRVAINTAITMLRKKKEFITSYEPANLPLEIPDDTTNDEAQWQELQIAISRLNEIEKGIVMLYMEDRSYKEMEDILGLSEGNIRVKMTRIKVKLRELTKK